ncbi:MAG TPA: phosphatidylglycerophosphatase A [Chromatiaceae bacterium]|nr:phosphatidylglycerophosphatase A [Chromatiaceae bacterium]
MKADMKNPVHLLAFGFGSGLAPRAPGTFGTLVGIAFFWPLAGLPPIAYLLVVAMLFALGIWLCGRTSRDLGVHDHGGIVWDEIVGLLVTLFGAPFEVSVVLVGFVLFRIFDILKPWPIGWLDRRVSGGFGIMIDDVLAGVFAAAILQLLLYLNLL